MQILLPKVISMGLVILLNTVICLWGILITAFDLPTKGSLDMFFVVTALYVFTMSGIGLFIVTISRSLGQVTMLVVLLLMPILLLSGAWTPPEAMPQGLHWAMALSPLHYFIEMGYDILLKGAGISELWNYLLA